MRNSRLILLFVLILCFMVSCQDKAAMAEFEEFRAQAAVGEQNIEITKRWLDEMDKGNLEIIDEICAEDFVCHFNHSI